MKLILAILISIISHNVAFGQTLHVPGNYPTIQQALDAANMGAGDVILVAPGTYIESLWVWPGLSVDITSSGGPSVTTIDGAGLVGIDCPGSVWGPRTVTVSGFTITHCESGIATHGGVISISNCNFLQNYSTQYGGGVHLNYPERAVVVDCLFDGNHADFLGGGIRVNNPAGLVRIAKCNFSNNSSSGWGGAARLEAGGGKYLVTNCRFLNNTAHTGAAGVDSRGTAIILQSIFAGNWAQGLGGALGADGDLHLNNCTISDNTANLDGPGIYLQPTASLSVNNSIVWGNNGSPEIYGANITANFSNIRGNFSGNNMISQNPRFVTPGSYDFRLSPGSPCIDAGNNNYSPYNRDLAGLNRFFDDLGTVDTGSGAGPIIDLGAFEFQGNSTGQVPSLTAFPNPLISGQVGLLSASSLLPSTPTFFAASFSGPGHVFVSNLEMFVDLNPAGSFVFPSATNSAGSATMNIQLPPPAAGRNVWLQGLQVGVKTNVASVPIQ